MPTLITRNREAKPTTQRSYQSANNKRPLKPSRYARAPSTLPYQHHPMVQMNRRLFEALPAR